MNRLERIEMLVRKMIARDVEYGCGFYGDTEWNKAYDALAEMCGRGADWRERAETRRYAKLLKKEALMKKPRRTSLTVTKREGQVYRYE